MRFHRHDIRDMGLAVGLGFDLRRVVLGSIGAGWTAAVISVFLGVVAWSAGHRGAFGLVALQTALRALRAAPFQAVHLLPFAASLLVWWLGFGRLLTAIQRSCAVEIARDEHISARDMASSSRRMGGMVTGSPLLALLVPGLLWGLVVVWGLLTLIPGTAGAVVSAVTLPIALLLAAIAAVMLVVVLPAIPMMPPASVVEGRDALEAVSRPTSYVLQKPGRYALQWGAKLLVMAWAAFLGLLVLGATWGLVLGAMAAVGEGDAASAVLGQILLRHAPPAKHELLAQLFGALFWASALIVAGWWLVVGAGTDVLNYLLMRYHIDGVTFDELLIPEEFVETHRLSSAADVIRRADQAEAEPAPAQDAVAPEISST